MSFAAIGRHLDDLGDKVALVSFVRPQAQSSLAGIARPAGPAWHRLSGDAASFEAVWSSFARGWNQQTQALSNRKTEPSAASGPRTKRDAATRSTPYACLRSMGPSPDSPESDRGHIDGSDIS